MNYGDSVQSVEQPEQSNSKLLVPLGEGGTGWVEGVKMWWKDVGQCEGWSLGGQTVFHQPSLV